MKRRDLTPEQRYAAFIHLKIVACGIILRNPTLALPIIRIPRIHDQEPCVFYDVNVPVTNNWLIESELFYKILLEDHRV